MEGNVIDSLKAGPVTFSAGGDAIDRDTPWERRAVWAFLMSDVLEDFLAVDVPATIPVPVNGGDTVLESFRPDEWATV